ncbi:hypothetical protein [Streptomyces endophyticus]|uniref:MarR family transcriptional regulator n=1 Tax=Streptomyces endophyticus TaxID=714166 RepID=A0ABU6FDM2_9ACTN|nr:hypothetical protein [Streptomyces endophyticus]MEB8340936.1 hypothetical protein [Streptomyces endophyticus]
MSLPEGSRETVQSLGEKMPEGRLAVRKARRQLEEEGYLHTRRRQDPETGRWTTQVLASNVPLTSPEEVAAVFGPSDQDPPAGDATGQALGAYPLGETPKDNTPNRGAAFLERLADREPTLRLGARDVESLAPLIDGALATGVTETDLRRCLTTDLPRALRSAAALVRYRLENRPPTAAPTPVAHKHVAPLGECAECRDPLPRGVGKGICRTCAGLAAKPTPAPVPAQGQGLRDVIALARAALRPVD